MHDDSRRPVDAVAAALAATGFVVQRRLAPHPALAAAYGPNLWSVRVLVLAGAPHRAVAKIATGRNPADNYWRSGNMLAAVDLVTGQIGRVVRGTGATIRIGDPHPDTGRPIAGTVLPDWPALRHLVERAAGVLPGIGTQSWDVALTAHGPVLLEVNFGGDLNLI